MSLTFIKHTVIVSHHQSTVSPGSEASLPLNPDTTGHQYHVVRISQLQPQLEKARIHSWSQPVLNRLLKGGVAFLEILSRPLLQTSVLNDVIHIAIIHLSDRHCCD